MSTRGTIVVGVDGSKGARTALKFALEEAARRGTAVRVLSVVPEPTFWATTYGMSPEMLDDLGAEVETTTWHTVDAVVREHGDALVSVPVEMRALEGVPARVLMRESQHFFAFLDRELDGLLERWREHRAQLDTHSPNGGTDAGRSREAPHR